MIRQPSSSLIPAGALGAGQAGRAAVPCPLHGPASAVSPSVLLHQLVREQAGEGGSKGGFTQVWDVGHLASVVMCHDGESSEGTNPPL